MSAATAQGWRRSKYPLQAPSPGSADFSPAASPSDEQVNQLFLQHQDKYHASDEAASWHRAVTAPTTDDFEGHDAASSTAVAASQRSVSPEPIARAQPSAATMEPYSPLLSPASDDMGDRSPVQEPMPDLTGVVVRTLRKSPPGRRIAAPIFLNGSDHTSNSTQPQSRSSEQKVATPVANSWARKAYPLQQATDMSATHYSPPSPSTSDSEPDEAYETNSYHQDMNQQAPAVPNAWSKRTYPLQELSIGSAALSTNEPEGKRDTQKKQQEAKQQAPATAKAWSKRTYPLQESSVASTTLPSSPPASDSDSESIDASDHQAQQHDQVQKKNKSWQRRGYPLQAPASKANLGAAAAPTPPASPPPTETSTAETVSDGTMEARTNETSKDTKGAAMNKSLHRKLYPLQSPASVTDLKHPQPSAVEDKPPQEKSGMATQRSKQEGAASQEKLFRRRGYPLQAPASTLDLKQSQEFSQSPSEAETLNDDKELTSKEKALAIKVTGQWRRETYPLQSPSYDSSDRWLLSPPPVEHEIDDKPPKTPKTKPILLPKNLTAVQDADAVPDKGRTIVICLDGTGDKFDNDNSNIVHLVSALKKDDPHQVTYYQAGIGTYGDGGLSGGITAAMDMAVGSGLGLHVRDAYHFLMHTYKENDRICIFGFSRGAYTARCLAGMVHKVGLLPPRNIQQIPFAYEFYKMDTDEGWKQSADFKKAFCIDVNIYFLGCFDSVASVGVIPRQLPLASTPTNKPRHFRHAMALDERRAKFKICRYQGKTLADIKKDAAEQNNKHESAREKLASILPNLKTQADMPPAAVNDSRPGKNTMPGVTDEEYLELTRHDEAFDTDVLEVWFAGAHADVGGGAVPNDERHKLAQIPLRWMIRQAFQCDTGIIFKTKFLAEYGLDVHTLWPKYESLEPPEHAPPPSLLDRYDQNLPPRHVRRSKLVPAPKHHAHHKGEDYFHLEGHEDDDWTPEQLEDYYDAMTTVNDQLIQAPTWWILEFMPVQYKVPVAPGEVILHTGMNWGRYRGVEDYEPKVHWTALHRMRQTNYKINARVAAHTKWRAVA